MLPMVLSRRAHDIGEIDEVDKNSYAVPGY